MKILVTGADGRIGKIVAEHLAEAGHSVTATDIRQRTPGRLPLQIVDLLDRTAVEQLVADHAAVVHFGNHASPQAIPDLARIYLENTTMNFNLFAAGAKAGVRKIIFASSIQVLHGLFGPPAANGRAYPPLPLDGDTAPCPNNLYGLSKLNGELLLHLLADKHGFEAVTLRLPLTYPSWPALLDHYEKRYDRGPADSVMAMMTAPETARLVDATLRATLPGYRCYLPTLRKHVQGLSAANLWREHFTHFPLRNPHQPLAAFIDTSRITRETGWEAEE